MSDIQRLIREQLQESQEVLTRFLSEERSYQSIATAAEIMANAIKKGDKIISCGNGGSHCDAMHFAEELSGRYRKNRKALAAIAISDVSHISCVANDFGFEYIFSRFVEGIGQKGDVLLAISTSGNSINILKAAEEAIGKGMTVIALTGNDGGKLSAMADIEIRAPHSGFADRIQEIHIKVIHIFILLIEKHLGYAS